MNVELIAWTPAPEEIVATAGKTCYSSSPPTEILDEMTEESADKFIDRLSGSGHESPIEHASFTFAVTGVSRSLLAQITRHRLASFSVQSQRFVDSSHFDYVTPAEISDNQYALRVFDDLMDQAARAYHDIHAYLMSARLKEKYGDMLNHEGLKMACNNNPKYFYLAMDSQMSALMERDHTEDEDKLLEQYKKDRRAAEKFANENARAILPNAVATNFVVTMNARELKHFFRMRCCNRAQDEIRHLADKMLELCKQVAPGLFKDAGAACVSGACPEGKMSCGNPRGMGGE